MAAPSNQSTEQALPIEYQDIVTGLFLNALLNNKINDHSYNYGDRYSDDRKKFRKHLHSVDLKNNFVKGNPEAKLIASEFRRTSHNRVRYMAYASIQNGAVVTKLVSTDCAYPPTPDMPFEILTMFNLFNHQCGEQVRALLKNQPKLKDHPTLGPIYQQQANVGNTVSKLKDERKELTLEINRLNKKLNQMLATPSQVDIESFKNTRATYIKLNQQLAQVEEQINQLVPRGVVTKYTFADESKDVSDTLSQYTALQQQYSELQDQNREINERLVTLREQLNTDNPPLNEICDLVKQQETIAANMKSCFQNIKSLKTQLYGATAATDQFVKAIHECVTNNELRDTLLDLYHMCHPNEML